MNHRRILSWIGVQLAASMVVGSTAFGQFVGGAPGTIINVNVGGNVGINTGNVPPPAPGGTACDPLEISTFGGGLPAALRLSNPAPIFPGCSPNFAQLGFEVAGGAFSTFSAPNDVVFANQGINGGDVIIAARTAGGIPGAIRLNTQNPDVQRMSIENNGNVSIGLALGTPPVNRLDLSGSMAIGAGYAGVTVAPPNSLLVQGRVGISTVLPTQALHVTGNVRFSGALMPNNLPGTLGQVLQSNGPGVAPTWVGVPPPAGAWIYGGNTTGGVQLLGSITDDLPIIAGGGALVYLDAANSGVMIGPGATTVTIPGVALDVQGDLNFSNALIANGTFGALNEILVSNVSGVPTWTPASTVIGSTGWLLSGNSVVATDFLGSTNNADVIVKAYGTETMRIISGGMVGTVGQVLVGGGAIGTEQFRVNGVSYLNGNTTVVGTFTVISDARLKGNVATLDNALNKVMALRGVSYDFRTSEAPDLNLPKDHQIGFIAQEVEQIVPEVVNTTDGGYKGVAYHSLVPLLVEGIKEQQGMIEAQKSTINDLSMRLARLEAMIDPSSKPTVPQTKDESRGIQLEQNTPNPFDHSTTIRYVVPSSIASAELVIFEAASGREVERFILANRGTGEVVVSVAGLASGNYVYGILADGKLAQTRTMVVAR